MNDAMGENAQITNNVEKNGSESRQEAPGGFDNVGRRMHPLLRVHESRLLLINNLSDDPFLSQGDRLSIRRTDFQLKPFTLEER